MTEPAEPSEGLNEWKSMGELARQVTGEGVFYTYNGKRAGPFSHEQEALVEFDTKVLPKTLGVDAKTLLSFRVNQPAVWSLMFTKDTKPDMVAEMLLRLHKIATFKDTGEVLVYSNGVYVKGGETSLAALIEHEAHEQCAGEFITSNFVRETIDHVKRRTYTDRKQFDTDPHILNLKNGLLNVESLKFQPHTPEYFSVNQLAVQYDPNTDCPNIKRFLNEVAFPEDLPALQEVVGYTLWKAYPAHIAVMLIGDGSNGKSTFINLLKSLLGIENVSSRSLQDLVMNRFAAADVYSKSANLYADLSDQALKFTGMFKMLTGNDPVTAEQKFRNPFVFMNYAKLIFSANKVPEVYEDSLAFFRRWLLFVFPNTFTGLNENRNLLKELTTPEELSGFLNWALEGLQRLKQNNWKFSNSKSVAQVREEYIRKSSPIQAFLMDCGTVNTDGREPKKLVFQAFCDYCRAHKLPVVTSDTFWKRLPEFIKFETSYETINGKRVHCLKGWTLRAREEWGKHNDDEDKNAENPEQPGRPEQSVQPAQPVHGLDYFSSARSYDQQAEINRILTKLQTLRVTSWDYAIEQAMKITDDRSRAESYLEQLRSSGRFTQDPEGNWRWAFGKSVENQPPKSNSSVGAK